MGYATTATCDYYVLHQHDPLTPLVRDAMEAAGAYPLPKWKAMLRNRLTFDGMKPQRSGGGA